MLCYIKQHDFYCMSLSKIHSQSQQFHIGEHEQLFPFSDNRTIEFQWDKRWLKGHQYGHILKNLQQYCQQFDFKKYDEKSHPKQIYSDPKNGLIYFVKGKGVGQDFGFPRMEEVKKKKYRWKKMNFTTDLPKKRPHVTYVVASAIRPHLIEENQSAQFRMHAVIPYYQGKNANENNEYILCHVRSVDQKKELQDCNLKSCFIDGYTDLYRLFPFLHNFCMDLYKE